MSAIDSLAPRSSPLATLPLIDDDKAGPGLLKQLSLISLDSKD